MLRKKYRIVIGSTTDNNPLYQDLESIMELVLEKKDDRLEAVDNYGV